jgi:CheY-like chemotaxis protein
MRTVLIVEDDPQLGALLEATLGEGFAVFLHAKDGEEALRLAQQLPDLVLLDVYLGQGISGLEVLARLRGDPATAKLRIAVITGYGDDKQVAAGLAAGADAFFVKPFSPLALLEWIGDEVIAAQLGYAGAVF